MTVAVCVHCGSMKFGAFTYCDACGVRPTAEVDIAYSLALTDHYFSTEVLNEISDAMRSGSPRPSLPKDQEDKFCEAARMHLKGFGGMVDLPVARKVD